MRRFFKLKRADLPGVEAVPDIWERFDRILRGLGSGTWSPARRRVWAAGGAMDEGSGLFSAGYTATIGMARMGSGERAMLMAEGLLRSRLAAELRIADFSRSSMLLCERCFWASWSMTAAYRRSMSACAWFRCASITFWSKDVGDEIMGVCGVLLTLESLLRNLFNHDDADRVESVGDASSFAQSGLS